MDIESSHAKLLRELQGIEQGIEALTPLCSQWNGTLLLETIDGERGSKSFKCDIRLRPDIVDSPLRWRTMIHEMFHACSAGFYIHDFNAYRGWEEGVVEQLSRQYRMPILEYIGVNEDVTQLMLLDRNHPFNRYIAALEAIRFALYSETDDFYLHLLMTPIRDRYASLMQQALGSEPSQRIRAIAALSKVERYELRK